ncbi:MAG: hypothetical protein QXH20_07170 [Candidatus Bathyarchaeia archaeon]
MLAIRQPNCQMKTNKAALTVAFIIACLLTFPSLSPAQLRWQYCLLVSPSSYPLRWGEKEPPNADMVAMPPGLDTSRDIPTSPGCYKVGTSGFSLAYSVEDQVKFGALAVTIWDEATGNVIWQRTYNFVPKQGQVKLEGFVLPDYIALVGFQVTWSGSGSIFTRFNVFVVLDAPKTPMDPAWVNLLKYSCWWSRFTNNLEDTAQAITFGVFFQRPGFAYPSDAASHWLKLTQVAT